MPPFDPYHLTPEISLNRVRIAALPDLPGLAGDPDLVGRTGYELVSAHALADLARAQAAALDLDPAQADDALCMALDARLAGAGPAQRAAAAIAQRIGRRLGGLLLTLRRGDPANRAARPEWTPAHWTHWARVRTVWLGGGLVSGRLGPYIVDQAGAVLTAGGARDVQVRLSPYGSWLPLVGAARYAPPETGRALIADFGGTQVKRAWADYAAGALSALHLRPTCPSAWNRHAASAPQPEAQAACLLDHMLDVLAEVWPGEPCRSALLSVATYMRDGQPSGEYGLYAHLKLLTDNVAHLLDEQLSARVGQPVGVTLLHDGTAAAAAHATVPGAPDESRSAVIVLGTALGIGFPPPDAGLRPLAPTFSLDGAPLTR